MSNNYACVFVLLLLIGCSSERPRGSVLVGGPDVQFQFERAELAKRPVVTPAITPFDAQAVMRNAYLEGFREGWNAMLNQWANVRFTMPTDMGAIQANAKAWTEGFRRGRDELTEQVLNLAKSRRGSQGNSLKAASEQPPKNLGEVERNEGKNQQ